MNMRRILKNPRLRMEDGGSIGLATATPESMAAGARVPGYQPMNAMPTALQLRDGGEVSPWSLKGMASAVSGAFTKTPAQIQQAQALAEYRARAAAERSAAAAAPTPAPAPAPTPAAAPMGSQSVLDRRMAAAGLRDGGDLRTGQGGNVPGTGSGDKIPAKYEPGEFVVSNAMLDAHPGLREYLRGLRKEVLADKGMTPEQADAKALSGETLRAQDGVTPQLGYDKTVAARANGAAAQAAHEAAQLEAAKVRAATRTQQARMMPPNAGPANAPPGYRGGQAVGKSVMNATRLAGKIAPAAGVAIEAGDVYDVSKDPSMSKIDVGTQAAEGVSKLAGAAAGGMAGASIGGPFAPVTGLAGGIAGYYAPEVATKALRWATGQDTTSPIDRVRTRESAVTAAPAAPKYVAKPDSVAPWGNESRRQVSNVNAPGGNVRGTEDFTKPLSAVPNDLPAGLRDGMVYKTKGANGEIVYSGRNVSGDVSGRMLNGDGTSAGPMRGSLRSAAGAPSFGPNGSYAIDDQAPTGEAKQAAIRATLTNPDGSAWTAQDNAIMKANLRDGADSYRGTSRGAAAQAQENAPKRGEFGFNNYMKNKQLDADRAVTLRGQDMDYAARVAGAKDASRAQANEDRKYALDVARLGIETENKDRDDTRAGEEAFDKRIASMSTPEEAPAMRAAVNGYLAKQEAVLVAALKKNPDDKAVASELAGLRAQGRSGLGDSQLRKLVMGFRANQIAAAGSGSNNPFNPWDGTSVNTNQPIQSLTPDQSFTSRWLPGAGKYVSDDGRQKILASDIDKNPDLRELIR